ncbi:hypothetical protein M9H77_24247 [Catharanthus roseus]|uniref:Uncharacterized protein n=1 Tax=Catharanthus roseus TaxID=4058 RepID=A0ACC0AWK4_CATRO|nr:hypothetical protein M9H77_24247 [Catharanthus roseus]
MELKIWLGNKTFQESQSGLEIRAARGFSPTPHARLAAIGSYQRNGRWGRHEPMDRLKVNTLIYSRNIRADAGCEVCQHPCEICIHALRDCGEAQWVWRVLLPPQRVHAFFLPGPLILGLIGTLPYA